MRLGSLIPAPSSVNWVLNVAAGRHDANLQLAFAPGFKNGIDGIVDDVQENLLDLMRVGDDHRRLGGQVAVDIDVVDLEIVVAQGQGFVEHFADVDFVALRLALAREGKQVLHYAVRALRLLE